MHALREGGGRANYRGNPMGGGRERSTINTSKGLATKNNK